MATTQKKIIVLAKEEVLVIGDERLNIKQKRGSWYFEDKPIRLLLRDRNVNPLKAILLEKDITQKQLADECNIQTYQISHLCQTDSEKDILLSTAIKLHEFLKEPIEEIFEDKFSPQIKCSQCNGTLPEEPVENIFSDPFCSKPCVSIWKGKFVSAVKKMVRKDENFMLGLEVPMEKAKTKYLKKKEAKETPNVEIDSPKK